MKKMIEVDSRSHTLVRNEIVGKMSAHLKMAAEMLESVKEAEPVEPDMDRIRTVIAKHHYKLFLDNNSQNAPTEDDQRHLDDLTDALVEKLFK